MRQSLKSALCVAIVVGLLLVTSQFNVVAAGVGARLEGVLLGVDGRPVSGHRVHLIGGEGDALGSSTTSAEGLYSFRGLEPGDYALMIEGPSGRMGALAGPPLRLGQNQLARRDLRLLEADPGQIDSTLNANYGLKARYASMSTAEQVWTWVVIVLVGGLTLFLVFDDDDDPREPVATEFEMGSN
jgi:hypothetical protein